MSLPRIANELSSLQHVYNPVAKETILAATKITPKAESPKTELGVKTVVPKTRQKKTAEPIAENLTEKKISVTRPLRSIFHFGHQSFFFVSLYEFNELRSETIQVSSL